MLHEEVHVGQVLNAGSFKIGGGIGTQYELDASSFEYHLGLEYGFSDKYMKYLEGMIRSNTK